MSPKQCEKCGRYITDSNMPWCDDCLRRKRPGRHTVPADWHREEGYEPKPAA